MLPSLKIIVNPYLRKQSFLSLSLCLALFLHVCVWLCYASIDRLRKSLNGVPFPSLNTGHNGQDPIVPRRHTRTQKVRRNKRPSTGRRSIGSRRSAASLYVYNIGPQSAARCMFKPSKWTCGRPCRLEQLGQKRADDGRSLSGYIRVLDTIGDKR